MELSRKKEKKSKTHFRSTVTNGLSRNTVKSLSLCAPFLLPLSKNGRFAAGSIHLQYHHFQNAAGSSHRDRNVEKYRTAIIQQHVHPRINGTAI